MTAHPVTIDIWSDVMCPWCVIGTRQLESALAGMEGEVDATIRFHPFELNPDKLSSWGHERVCPILGPSVRTPEERRKS